MNDVLACRLSCLASTQLLPGATGRKTGAGEVLTSSGVKRRPSILSVSVSKGVLGSPESTVNKTDHVAHKRHSVSLTPLPSEGW